MSGSIRFAPTGFKRLCLPLNREGVESRPFRPRPNKNPSNSKRYSSSKDVNNNANNNGNSNNNGAFDEGFWRDSAPGYLQNSDEYAFCDDWLSAFPESEKSGDSPERPLGENSPVWQAIRREAERDAASEPLLSSFLYASILAHKSFDRALAFVLANRLANATMLPTQLFEIFLDVLRCSPEVLESSVADVEAVRERDPACLSYSSALLYYKGYHALQVHRIAHALWNRGQKFLALTLQSRLSEVFAVDIHPAATIGKGVLIDHGTGVVIGETAVLGKNCSILQNVTLGGTGKEVGDRHPKIQENVLIGASATILGNIIVGKGAQVAAGSLVLKPVPPHTMVAGSPAKEVGKVSGNPALKMEHWSKVVDDPYLDLWQQTPTTNAAESAKKAKQNEKVPKSPAVDGSIEEASKPEGADQKSKLNGVDVLGMKSGEKKIEKENKSKRKSAFQVVNQTTSKKNPPSSKTAGTATSRNLRKKRAKAAEKEKSATTGEPEYFI
ncbi:hypothetical protein BSKO_12799 [Bryopsis sp. KO-2023]|nr:hypothetical protein BSKO_12799 [Bryopsis sp. KO-2023]